MRVLAVTSWGGACGIANYAEQMIEAVRGVNPSIEFDPQAAALDPAWVTTPDSSGLYSSIPDVVWLNYHRGLHSRWTPEIIYGVQTMGRPRRVVITFHDTYGERPPDALTQDLYDVANAFIVHEPCQGLPQQILIRQGVLGWPDPWIYDQTPHSWCGARPVLGTVGFNFPWKNFDRLAEVTAACGWAYLVCSNNATDADETRWKTANPYTLVMRGFQPTETLVSYLAGCDATCFAYECANSGTSGAIRLGLAARKPVIAWVNCRQFRDLWELHEAYTVHWCEGFSHLPLVLRQIPITRVDSGIVALAHRDAWTTQGRRYAEIFQGLSR